MRIPLAAAALAAGLAAALPAAAAHNAARIAFSSGTFPSGGDIVVYDVHGELVANLTPGNPSPYTDDRQPSWSPDGARIAFMSHRDAFNAQEIYVMNADGTDQRRLTYDSGDSQTWNVEPAWAPDGSLIAFRKAKERQPDEIWVMKPDGSGQRRVALSPGDAESPQWSPDSTRLLYERSNGPREIYVVDVAGGEPRNLTPPNTTDLGAAWSPDGRRIAFVSGSGLSLAVMNADGSDRRVLGPRAASPPSWSPDGSAIAFSSMRIFPEHGSRFGPAVLTDVYLIRPDGTNLRRLTGAFHDEFESTPSSGGGMWWPDGSRLFFGSARRSEGNARVSELYVMNADGTCERPFTSSPQPLGRGAWRPGVLPELPPTRCAELRLYARASTDAVALRQPAQVTVVIENDGNETATDLRIAGDVTAGGIATSDDPSCEAGRASCALPPLAPGRRTTVAFAVSSARAGTVSLRLRVSAAQPDGDEATNATVVGTEVLPCTQVGTTGNDTILGSPGRDLLCGRTGADRISGLAGADRIDAGNGNDTVEGGPGRDVIVARGGWDVILARDGERDTIECGVQRDVVVADRRDRVARDCERVFRR